ncbi:hypothetical protein D3C75_1167760 [compost metagenome]
MRSKHVAFKGDPAAFQLGMAVNDRAVVAQAVVEGHADVRRLVRSGQGTDKVDLLQRLGNGFKTHPNRNVFHGFNVCMQVVADGHGGCVVVHGRTPTTILSASADAHGRIG